MRACRRGQKNTRFESPCKGYFSRQAAPRAIRHLYRVVVSLHIENQLTSTSQATKQTVQKCYCALAPHPPACRLNLWCAGRSFPLSVLITFGKKCFAFHSSMHPSTVRHSSSRLPPPHQGHLPPSTLLCFYTTPCACMDGKGRASEVSEYKPEPPAPAFHCPSASPPLLSPSHPA
jgi:hypothetical protein